MTKRRDVIRYGFGVLGAFAAADILAACTPSSVLASPSVAPLPASPSPLPPPETKTIRMAIGACDMPIFAAERNLRDEGFTDVQFSDSPAVPALTGGKADMVTMFVTTLAVNVEAGVPLLGLGGLHTGCAQVWAPTSVASMKDLVGRTVVVRSKAPTDNTYAYIAIGLKNAGIDPSAVNFVVQPDADLTKMYLDGKSDALFLAAQNTFAFQTNPANTGHVVLDQATEAPWSQEVCCVLATTTDWAKANPAAAKRALRAIYRAADSIPMDRADLAKASTDAGLFGGAKSVAVVRGAANMVPYAWRTYDLAESTRFHAKLLNGVGLLKMTPDEAVTQATDLRFTRQLQSEIVR